MTTKRTDSKPRTRKRRARDHWRPDPRTEKTRTKLLDAAEELFAAHGYHGASLRQITLRAKTNVASINYHFSNKTTLLEAVIARRLRPIATAWEIRLRACRGLREEPCVDCIIRAFLEPLLEALSGSGSNAIGELFRRMLNDPDPAIQKIANRPFDGVWAELHELAGNAMPNLSPSTAAWRVTFMLVDTLFLCTRRPWLRQRSRGLCDPDDIETATTELSNYIKGGMLGLASGSRGNRTSQT